jgi:RNA polymerase sigma factor (sigma-70 family)
MDEKQLNNIIEGCCRGDRNSQERLYRQFYKFAMAISLRYATVFEEAEEITNDAFVKAFRRMMVSYNSDFSFSTWLRRIIVNTAIDRYRLRLHQPMTQDIEAHSQTLETDNYPLIEHLTREQILGLVQHLPPPYRTVFNLYVVDGYNHVEIADMLSISVGTSKSTLSRARQKLKDQLVNDAIFD